MRFIACSLVWLGALVAQSGPVPLTQGERDRALSHLHATRKMFLDAVAGLTPAQWEFKPAPEVWSIAEVAEHITLSEDMLFEIATQRALKAPTEPLSDFAPRGFRDDEKLLAAVLDRSTKVKAPEALTPRRSFPTPADLISEFKRRRDRTLEYVRTTEAALRAHRFPHPVLGPLDAYQWLLLVSAHCERHILQLNEVKQHPGFPK
ncbi:MAG: DinB family protein [Bryobacteraceae bacterium]|nr:DinB family protein [Bryobacteraceae bacterium]MDW8376834.1 DinB family protein [Bryobacterales bacterium]